jgi:hypothetical protein
MTENETVCSLHKKEATAIVCVHLCTAGNDLIGFNVSEDIKNDLEAWCDKCEKMLNKAGEWTDTAVEFADFRPCCVGCFISLKDRMRS